MKNIGKISVVLPCCNAERFVGGIIADIKKQRYTNWELIVVSNGERQERQLEVIYDCAGTDCRIRVMDGGQAGVSNARNIGIQNATGEWLAFVDADDRCGREYLANLSDGTRDDVDMVAGGITVTDSYDGRNISEWNMEEGHGLDKYYLSASDVIANASWNKLFRVSKLREWGGLYDPSASFSEDAQFVFKFLQYTPNINTIRQTTYCYTLANTGSFCKRYCPNREQVSKEVLGMRLALMRQVGVSNEEIATERRKALQSISYFCALNVFKQGSPLSFRQRVGELRRIVFDDKESYGILTSAERPKSRLLFRVFNLLVDLRSPLLMALVYEFLFSCQALLASARGFVSAKSQRS